MTARRALTVVAAVAAVLLTGAVGAAQSSNGRSAVELFVPDLPPIVVDRGPTGDELGAGDTLLFNGPVRDPDTGADVGSAVTRVRIVEPLPGGDAIFILDCTVRTADGTVVFYGAERLAHLGNEVTYAVTGGTGRYAGTTGTVTITPGELDGVVGGHAAFRLSRR